MKNECSPHPRDGAPRNVVAHGLEVYHCEGCYRWGRQPSIRVRRESNRQDSNDEHVGTHQSRTGKKGTPASKSLDQKEQEKKTGDDLDDAEEPGEEKVIVAGPDKGEDLRRIWKRTQSGTLRIVDRIDSCTYSKP